MMWLTPRGRRHRIRTTRQARRLRTGILAATSDSLVESFDPADPLQLRAFIGARVTGDLWFEAAS